MLDEFLNIIGMDETKEDKMDSEVKELLDGLEMFSGDPKMLTNTYTQILCNENVVYLLTRISQLPIFSEHFPEFYIKNENGESVINCQQNSPYHRYGVFRHVLYTIEYVGKENLKFNRQDLKILKWTMLLHDIGKPFVKTTNTEGKDSFAGHEEVSVELATGILDRFYFDEYEKHVILTLIKYHDRYLNEGELTQENLKFLAKELDEKRELLNMLVEVKKADNRAKSIEVFNKFETVLPKYLSFIEEYFGEVKEDSIDFNDEMISGELLETNEELITSEKIKGKEKSDAPEIKVVSSKKIKASNIALAKERFEEEYQNVLYGRDLEYTYSTVIEVSSKNIYGYQINPELQSEVLLKDIVIVAKEEGKYDKVNQLLLLNSVEKGIEQKSDKQAYLIVKCDLKSFMKYNNKSRIYDLTDKDNVIILFNNYTGLNSSEINSLATEMKKKHCFVGLENFDESGYSKKQLQDLKVDVITYKYNKDKLEEIQELNSYCLSDAKTMIVTEVKSYKEAIKADLNFVLIKDLFDGIELPNLTNNDVENSV
ncbi:MAG: HD domain-containing protein [Clostridia bacterium]|nr:HD domain-containing protein [Clostridia bacterium]